ncbi:ABC transporter permease [Caulobacter sp. FWC2]|uniref:ABC transporter permease n=1 Tax=Caulobacter sp. FWC2 TaxID=69664 RepID=UPI000C15E615|nr:ABC transporter permease [Caulobacter sp. FWC2]PIB90517.1 peptide ABC transporter permease [Caulobacter sp. FWC2]
MSRARLSPTLMVGGVISIAFVAAALVSLVWTPYDAASFDIGHRLQSPTAAHWLGLDHFGRDVASMILLGARNALSVSLVAVLLGAGVGVPLGLLAAARRGVVDELVMRASDVVFAFPALILAILITAVLGPGAINAVIAIGVFNVPVFARLTRGSALTLWTRDYVLAARAAGKGVTRISLEHIAPGLLSVLIVQATLQFSLGVIAEAGLSYVGLGVQPPAASWGKMLADAQTLVSVAPLQAIFPGLAIVITVLGLNLLGDGLRDRLDPRLDEER